jgi:hypothetical protein
MVDVFFINLNFITMKFTAIYNNSYPKNGTWVHVYGIQLPEDISVADFHSKLSDPRAKALLDNGQPRFNVLSDEEEVTSNHIDVWLSKKGRLSNLTQLAADKEEQKAFNKIARISGVKREVLATQGLAMLLNVKAPAATTEEPVAKPAQEIEGIM